jgi:CheY-like chemotaxis protein
MRVLIIDDDPDIRRIAEVDLGRIGGFGVASATTGAEGLDLARAEPFDAILLDLTLPDQDGARVLAALLGDPATADIPVLLLTARDQDEVDEALQAGARGVIPKPFQPTTLHELVRRLVEGA